ncbi:regulatory protein RecX [Taibaiella koreensis]|uniref:regulatory protein RecX n=1 Tax=Taibaiella koreensis TaxID=1268548 RepID=UPI000E599286|nr:regulatory protein RecX [Taibaiella koreensis]
MNLDLSAIRHYCAYQERCHSEVRHKLLELGFRGATLEEAMAALIADDFLNEERFARSYSGGKFRVRQWGRRKIEQALKQKQVSAYCIRKGLQEIDPGDYYHTLQQLADKKWQELKSEKMPWIRKQKVLRYLLQKGYEADLVSGVLQER